jgi:transposase InsO family protein
LSCSGTSSRSSAGRLRVRRSSLLTGRSWLRRVGFFHGHAGGRFSLRRTRSFVGIATSCADGGRLLVAVVVDRSLRGRSANWCCGSHARTRAGGISGSSEKIGGLGLRVSATSVRQILRREGLGPVGERGGLSWHEFLRTHAQTMISCDFFTVDTLWLGRLYVLFFIELGSRRVHLAGCTANPSGEWVAQQARNLCWSLQERRTPLRFLIHDRDSKFTRAFDEIFRTEGLEIIRTPFRAPKANAVAERFVRTVRAECLDWLLIAGSRQLERTLRTFTDHYNAHRPHRALGLTPPQKDRPPLQLAATDSDKHLRRRDRLGGLIHEYSVAA